MSKTEQAEVLALLDEYEQKTRIEKARTDLLAFVTLLDPDYKVGAHHRKLANLLEQIARGEKDRVIVNIAPRFGKSHLVSYYYPAWFLGQYPDKKVMMTSHTQDLAVDFGRKVRNLIDSEEYKRVFPGVSLSADSKSAGRWHTNRGGEYFAIGVGGALAGRGADLLLVDDPHSEQDVLAGNTEVFEKAYLWFSTGARTRLMPGGRVALVQTRWATNDLTGRLIKDQSMNEDADQYEVVEFPAILQTRHGERSLWPEQWSLEALKRTRASMPNFQWSAQYQQDPTSEEGAIIKRDWWRLWDRPKPPKCQYIIQSWDTAFEKTSRADYSACTTWGVWYDDSDLDRMEMGKKPFGANILLLDAYKARLEFPDLKAKALQLYEQFEPDSTIIEKKASGAPLIYELRSIGVPVSEFVPSKGQDKVARLNSVADLFASRIVWAPPTRWAEELQDEVASFPVGDHDDYVDALTLALMRFRQGGFLRVPSDQKDENEWVRPRRSYGYY